MTTKQTKDKSNFSKHLIFKELFKGKILTCNCCSADYAQQVVRESPVVTDKNDNIQGLTVHTIASNRIPLFLNIYSMCV